MPSVALFSTVESFPVAVFPVNTESQGYTCRFICRSCDAGHM